MCRSLCWWWTRDDRRTQGRDAANSAHTSAAQWAALAKHVARMAARIVSRHWPPRLLDRVTIEAESNLADARLLDLPTRGYYRRRTGHRTDIVDGKPVKVAIIAVSPIST